MLSVNELNDVLKSETIYELPSWINECSREDQQLFVDSKQINYEEINPELDSLASYLNTSFILTAVVTILGIVGLCTALIFGNKESCDASNVCACRFGNNRERLKREYMERVK